MTFFYEIAIGIHTVTDMNGPLSRTTIFWLRRPPIPQSWSVTA